MKTSLNIDDNLYREAKAEALRSGRSVSDVITAWAREGRIAVSHRAKQKPVKFSPADLGGPPKLDLSSRRDWLDTLDDI